jgi:exoribonuclease-2
MPQTIPREGSLVLYKNRPARVQRIGEKLELELEGGQIVRVRLKDVICLHPGPLRQLGELQPQAGEVEIAWEMLVGSAVPLAELTELAYGTYTPATAWAAWQLVADGLYFRGTPEAIVARSPEEVARERAAREAKAAEELAWVAFLERARTRQLVPEDVRYLEDVEALALGQRATSRTLEALGRADRPENAHALLLELGYWDERVNPYPQRLGLESSPPAVTLPELPEEPRLDLTHLPAFAIDDEGNQDPDDAVSLDGDRLWVHVADVAALVVPESAADLAARGRGANLYLPEGTVPMLPPQATRLLGLGLNAVSPALSFGLDLNPDGEVATVELAPSWVRVTRLTYAEADARLEEEPFQRLHQLTQAHEARRLERGAISMDLPEVKIRVVEGEVSVCPLPPLRSRELVAEAMLMAGAAVARFALEHDIPFPFSTQEPPFIEAPERPLSLAGAYALRRALRRSQVGSLPGPHAGLGLDVYAQVTSPLRRYLDLVAHQQLRAFLRGQELLRAQDVLERIGAAEAAADGVRQAERLSRQHWTLVYLLAHPAWRGDGVVVEKRGAHATVLIPELDLEPRVHMREELPLDTVVPLALRGVNLPALDAHFEVSR